MKRYKVARYHAGKLLSQAESKTKYAAADDFLSEVYWMIHGESLLDRQHGHNVINGAKALADKIRREGLHECSVNLTDDGGVRGKVSLTLA